MNDFSRVAYAPLKISFDRDRFIYEFDRYILTRSQPQYNEARERDITAAINQKWKMVDPDLYCLCDGSLFSTWNQRSNQKFELNGMPSWRQFALTELAPHAEIDPDLDNANYRGSVAVRNAGRHRTWRLKHEIQKQNLSLCDFIYNSLELESIKFVAGVSLEAGRFATIHRDSMQLKPGKNYSVLENRLYQEGFVVININISNGGVPLYWSLDGADLDRPRTADDDIYMTSDYFLHGVPVVQDRRRQVRITGRPNEHFHKLVDWNQAVILPDQYQFDNCANSLSLPEI